VPWRRCYYCHYMRSVEIRYAHCSTRGDSISGARGQGEEEREREGGGRRGRDKSAARNSFLRRALSARNNRGMRKKEVITSSRKRVQLRYDRRAVILSARDGVTRGQCSHGRRSEIMEFHPQRSRPPRRNGLGGHNAPSRATRRTKRALSGICFRCKSAGHGWTQ